MNILFSIIIPLYNKELYIKETIESVLQQTYQHFEIIIVNDCSTDLGHEIVNQIQDHRIVLIHHQENKGLSATRNTAIKHCKGEIICLLDADDLWEPNYLQSIFDLQLKFPETVFFGTDYIEKYPFGEIEPNKTIECTTKNTSFIIDDFFKSNMGQPIICPSSLSFKKNAISGSETPFNTSITFAEDIDFYIRYFSKHQLAYCYQPLVKHRDGNPDQMTQNNISNKNLPDFHSYQKLAKDHHSLLRYVDFQRYCFAINLRMEQNFEKANQLENEINLKHLNNKQKLLLNLPYPILKYIKTIKSLLLKRRIKLSSY